MHTLPYRHKTGLQKKVDCRYCSESFELRSDKELSPLVVALWETKALLHVVHCKMQQPVMTITFPKTKTAL